MEKKKKEVLIDLKKDPEYVILSQRNQKIKLISILIVPLHFFTYLESGERDDSKYVTFSPVGETASLY
jgi:hypothetical protein